jgi:hypothetical protein
MLAAEIAVLAGAIASSPNALIALQSEPGKANKALDFGARRSGSIRSWRTSDE